MKRRCCVWGRQLVPRPFANCTTGSWAWRKNARVIQGRKLRVDTTVVESNIHYPTDSGLLNDGARVLTRTMKQIEGKAGSLRKKVRNRMRTVTKRVIAIGQALRYKGPEGELKRKKEYRQLLRVTRQILNDSRSVLQKAGSAWSSGGTGWHVAATTGPME